MSLTAETPGNNQPDSPRRRYSACIGCRDPHHVARWVGAMNAARASRSDIRCAALTSTGQPCKRTRMRGSDKCHNHLLGAERDAVDAKREPRVRRALHHGRHRLKPAKHQSALGSIARRALRRAWRFDPMIQGSTLHLDDASEQRVAEWLQVHHRIDIDTDGTLTARFVDKARWSGLLVLSGAITPAAAAHRLHVARKEMDRWRAQTNPAPSAEPIPE